MTIQNTDFLSQLATEAETLERELKNLSHNQRVEGRFAEYLASNFKHECVSALKDALVRMQCAFKDKG
jgi:hypothetical protein